MAASSAAAGPEQDRLGEPPQDWTIDAARAWLSAKTNFERVPDRSEATRALKLERMLALAEAMGNPQRRVPAIHVAGSKGKGSITRMAASILSAAGLKTGAFTSPHLIAPNERIAVDRMPITDRDLARALWRVAQAEGRVPEAIRRRFGEPTYFEAITAAAFDHFSHAACQAAVYEVGLGGRLDSTNVLEPEICVLASIELEHTEILGDTLELIAAEKAGILKPRVRAIATPQAPEVLTVFRERAAKVGAPLTVLGEDASLTSTMHEGHAAIVLTLGERTFAGLRCPLPGSHQAANTAAAVASCALLLGDRLTDEAVQAGLAATPRDGRLEVIARQPTVIIDGAHTPTSVRATLESLPSHEGPLVIIFGCARDKDARGMLAELSRHEALVIMTEAGPRASPAADLARLHAQGGRPTREARDVAEAVRLARRQATERGLVVALGSFMIAGAVKASVQS